MFEKTFEKIKGWYFGLPWWGKLLGFLVLVFLIVLLILKYVLGGPGVEKTKSDAVHEAGVTATIDAGKKTDATLDTGIAQVETDVAAVTAESAAAEVTTQTTHQKIKNAGSFAEVDKIVKLLILAVIFICPLTVRAEVYTMPTGTDVTINGVAMRAFNLDEYKTMANIYADYKFLLDEKVRADKEFMLYKDMKVLYEQKDANCKNMLGTMTSDRDFWKTRLEETKLDKSYLVERWGLIAGIVVEAAALVVWGVVDLSQ